MFMPRSAAIDRTDWFSERPSTFASACSPPLTTHELVAFKTAVSILARFGRLMARTAREAVQTGVMTRDLQQELSRCRALVSEVERRMHQFAQAALVTWESRVD